MPSIRIRLVKGNYYHIYNKCIENSLLFCEEGNFLYFLTKMKKYLLVSAEVLAYCLMPDHYHFIVRVTSESFSRSMQKLALSYVISYNNMYKRKGHLFLGPFRRKQIGDSPYLLHLSRYIHLNPVSAKLVKKAEDWKFSSYREYIGYMRPDFINSNTILNLLHENVKSSLDQKQRDYQEFVEDWDCRYMKFKKGTKSF